MEKLFSTNEAVSSLSREEIEEQYKWNLSDIYISEELWEEDFKYVENNISKFQNYKGKLAESADLLLECFKFDDEMGIKTERLYLYAMLSRDSDMRVNKYQGMDSRIKSLYNNLSAASSFIRPELLSIPDEKLLALIDSKEELRVYKHSINELLRRKAHTLNKEEEEILAMTGEIMQVPYNTYSLFTNADLKFPVIKDSSGNDVEMSHAKYYAALYSPDRDYRERAFKAYLKPYKEFVNTFTSLFNGNLKGNIFNAKVRKYSSAREASLDKNNIPVSVYDNLIEAANNNLKPLHRWASLKKEILKVNELHPYDVYVSLFSADSEKKYTYEEGVQTVLKALRPMGEDYLEDLTRAFNNRWIDVYETPAKRSGAYSSGTTFGVHPYVLLNWTNLLNDVFTLAHEMGHNMHSYYTGKYQPYPYSNYSIFLAEVASTFNESVLLDYLITVAETKSEKLFLLEKYLNNITATFYRQTMFAEYEMKVYEISQRGDALTNDILCRMYKEMFQKYWGPEMVIDEQEEYTWARIPHYYYNFYVYQYATGYAASEVLARKVKDEGLPAVKNYLKFLKSGSSDYSIEILKRAGVDMNSPEPVIATTQKMNQLLNEVESLI